MQKLNGQPIGLRKHLACWALVLTARADEQFLGFTRGAETLPQGRNELWDSHVVAAVLAYLVG